MTFFSPCNLKPFWHIKNYFVIFIIVSNDKLSKPDNINYNYY